MTAPLPRDATQEEMRNGLRAAEELARSEASVVKTIWPEHAETLRIAADRLNAGYYAPAVPWSTASEPQFYLRPGRRYLMRFRLVPSMLPVWEMIRDLLENPQK